MFTVGLAVVVSVGFGRHSLPRTIRWLFSPWEGGAVRRVLTVIWAIGMVVLSKAMVVIAFTYALQAGDVLATLPPVAEVLAAAGWCVLLFRASCRPG